MKKTDKEEKRNPAYIEGIVYKEWSAAYRVLEK